MLYPKINSLWKRDCCEERSQKKKKGSLIIGDYSAPEFGNIKKWSVDEKIDGTNIRVIYENGQVKFGGRTNDAQLPCHLLDNLQNIFTEEKVGKVFCEELETVILFGEGYGAKIQSCGGNYRQDASFILFDILVGKWWLRREDVLDVAQKLNISCVPSFGILEEPEIVELVKSRPLSKCSSTSQEIEGVVCRAHPLMLFRNGLPIMWKLKCRDFLEKK